MISDVPPGTDMKEQIAAISWIEAEPACGKA